MEDVQDIYSSSGLAVVGEILPRRKASHADRYILRSPSCVWLPAEHPEAVRNAVNQVVCDPQASRDWKALSNGELVEVTAAAGFRCLLTRDQLFGESASRALKSFPQLSVVVITLPQQRWEDDRRRFLEAWAVSPIQPVPGKLTRWP